MTLEIAKLAPPVSNKRDHIQGPDTVPATLVEFGDYECPYCGQAYPIIKEIQKYLGNNLRFVFRNFPLTQIHPHAQHAAEAAEAAGAQNKFWEMHDYLYEYQQALDDKNLEKYAGILGLGMVKFKDDFYKHVYASRVREDFLSGVRSGVNGTPSFFLNGIHYNNSWDYEILSETLVSIIKEKQLADK
jgi:protein-disulfide isomerase